MDLADRAKIKTDTGRVLRAVKKYRRVLVCGPTGSGRGQVFADLRGRGDVIAVEAPPVTDMDAAVHPLLAAAAALDRRAVNMVEDGRPLDVRAARLASRLAFARKTLVLRLPSSWRALSTELHVDPVRQLLVERAALMLHGLVKTNQLQLVLLADSAQAIAGITFVVGLRPMVADIEAATARPEWGSYSRYALELAKAARDARVEMTPVQLRLGVGLLGLGDRAARVVDAVRYGGTVNSSLEMLENRLVSALRAEPIIAAAVGRVALARFGLPRDAALALSKLPPEHAPLLTECLAYGGQTVGMHDRVRAALVSLAGEGALLEAAHHDLARHHRSADGTPSVAKSASPRDWLERAFHLGLSGERGGAEWSRLEIPSREFYWTRGRALSLAGLYESAAAVYHKCVARFPDDDYAAHYEAYNRDRAGIGDQPTENGYRKAIEKSPSNAWWNGRLVTFLIARARFLAAREEWGMAVGRLDPDGVRGTWLALHFHRWVVAAWLDAGEVELAREAFDAIQRDALDDGKLGRLERRLVDMEEARTMGYSVYPASYPLQERWVAPQTLPARSATGAPRIGWYPARVVEADAAKVLLAIGIPPESSQARKRTALKDFDLATWARAAQTTDPPTGYWFLGSYDGGEVQAVQVESRSVEPLTEADPLRFLRRSASAQAS